MSENNVILSISFLEFINQISSLINEILYSNESGYTFLKSKDAVKSFSKIIAKFDFEAAKLKKNVDFSDVDKFIEMKKNDLISIAKKHYESQIPIWADEVFDNLIDNLMFELSLDKSKSASISEHILCALDWICQVKKINEKGKSAILTELKKEFNQTLNKKETDYIPAQFPKSSDEGEFVKYWNMIFSDEEKFLNTDFSASGTKLSQADSIYFQNLKNKLNSNTQINQKDELDLLSSAIDILKIKDNKEIYNFIKQINQDFNSHYEENRIIKEEDKIKLIKRRIELFRDKNKNSKEYFKKMITSSSNE